MIQEPCTHLLFQENHIIPIIPNPHHRLNIGSISSLLYPLERGSSRIPITEMFTSGPATELAFFVRHFISFSGVLALW
ncbi:MAG: hypothetical protein EAX81_08220 [Candidatus Thorarchaeota archaeon]|nr:hypothetical protein [Candidatus Thorarchaeota archaeon]